MNFIFTILTLHLLFYTTQGELQNTISPQLQEEVDSIVQSFMAEHRIPGLGLSLIKTNASNPETVYSTGYGLRNIEDSIPADNNTLFAIGSVSKSFTATVIVKYLVETFPDLNESVLDVPIRVLAPEYNFTLGDRYRSEKTSFRDLLSHRVCTLPDFFGIWVGAYPGGRKEFLYRQRYASEICGFRSGFLYNNGLIEIAGDIIAIMANSTFEDLLQNLFNDVGMKSTTWINETDDYNNMPGRAVPYFWDNGAHVRFNTELLKAGALNTAAGGILSNANDMLKYLQFHLNLGRVGDTQIVPAVAMKWLQNVVNPLYRGVVKTEEFPNAKLDLDIGYGLGLVNGIYDGWTVIWHDGYIPPFSSLMSFYPVLGLGIFTTWNGPGASYIPENETISMVQVHSKIFDAVLGTKRQQGSEGKKVKKSNQTDPLKALKTAMNFPKTKVLSEMKNAITADQVVGSYGSGLNGDMKISLRDFNGTETLYWEYGLWARAKLYPDTNTSGILHVEWEPESNEFRVGIPNAIIYFEDLNTAYIISGTAPTTAFKRNETLADLPNVPWSIDSC